MFRSAIFRLTTLYLAVIMLISLFFSLNLYRISTEEIIRSLSRQQNFLQRGGMMNPLFDNTVLRQERQAQIDTATGNVMWQLIYTNIGILFFAGGVSYLFARMTIRPMEEAHEKQSRFTSDASHELRSPLAVMRSEIEVALRDKKATKAEVDRVLASSLEEVTRMEQLVSGLLELTRDSAAVNKEKVDAHKLVDEVVSKYAKTKNNEFMNSVEKDLVLITDKVYLSEILNILVDNAVKYSGGKVCVTVASHKHLKQVEIAVSDDGVGITPEDIDHIFDRFYRADRSRTKNQISGYGLGLSIAKKLTEHLGGTISVQSKVGKGSTFMVRLSQ